MPGRRVRSFGIAVFFMPEAGPRASRAPEGMPRAPSQPWAVRLSEFYQETW